MRQSSTGCRTTVHRSSCGPRRSRCAKQPQSLTSVLLRFYTSCRVCVTPKQPSRCVVCLFVLSLLFVVCICCCAVGCADVHEPKLFDKETAICCLCFGCRRSKQENCLASCRTSSAISDRTLPSLRTRLHPRRFALMSSPWSSRSPTRPRTPG